jgi:hypothetical protein
MRLAIAVFLGKDGEWWSRGVVARSTAEVILGKRGKRGQARVLVSQWDLDEAE